MLSFLFPTASKKPAKDITFRLNFEFDIRGFWIGIRFVRIGNCNDFFICLIPFIILHFCYHWSDPEQ